MIRLTLLLLAGMFGAMMIWGTDGPEVESEQITAVVLPEDTDAPVEIVQAAEVVEELEVAAEPVMAKAVAPEAVPTNAVIQEAVADVVAALTGRPGPTSAPAEVANVSPEPEPEETGIEVAQLETIDLTSPEPAPGLAPVGNSVIVTEQGGGDAMATEHELLTVTGSRVNMRAGPSTSLGVVGNLARGQQAELLAEADNGWMKIRAVESGTVGFMAGRFLKPVTQ